MMAPAQDSVLFPTIDSRLDLLSFASGLGLPCRCVGGNSGRAGVGQPPRRRRPGPAASSCAVDGPLKVRAIIMRTRGDAFGAHIVHANPSPGEAQTWHALPICPAPITTILRNFRDS